MNQPTNKGSIPVANFAILILLTLLALLFAAIEAPLEGMHWDVPIYLYQAKRFAETHFLANYIHHAAEIAAQVHGHLPADEWFSEAYWRFARLGHIAVLGGIVSFFGSTLTAIVVATWLYTFFLIGGMAFCFFSVLMLGRTTDRARSWFTGAAISTLLFLLSDIYGYLAGNLISEVLSIFLLGAAVLALLHSVNGKHLPLAILSGLLAFLSYTVRVESVWTWLTFIVAYAVTRGGGGIQSVPWKQLLAAGFTALCCFVVYAAVFNPLVDPRHYLAFVSGLTTKEPGGVPGYQLLFVAGGLLWVGTFVCLRWMGRSGLVRLGWIWLALSALPWLPQIMLGGPAQTRMMTLLIPPLFLLSSAGWSLLLEQRVRRLLKVVTAVSLCLVMVSQPVVYAWLHEIPGIWRIQFARPFLFVPNYERLDYLPTEMAALSHTVINTNEPTVLISAPGASSQEHLNLIRFFGPSYQPDADLALVGDPTNRKGCDSQSPTFGEPVLFCTGYASSAVQNAHRVRYRLLVLRRAEASTIPRTSLLLKTPHFAIDEFQ